MQRYPPGFFPFFMHRFHVTVRLIDETTYEMAYRYSQGGDDVKKSCMDKNQFAKRLQEQKSKYYRMAYSYVKNEHDALDIIGEASYKGLKELHTLKQPEDSMDLFEALDALSERDRACVLLRYFEEYSFVKNLVKIQQWGLCMMQTAVFPSSLWN